MDDYNQFARVGYSTSDYDRSNSSQIEQSYFEIKRSELEDDAGTVAYYFDDCESDVYNSDSDDMFGLPESGNVTMRRDKKKHNVAQERIPVGEDASKLIAELAPGKKGGDFDFPFSGKASIPQGLLGKKDVITCCMVSPSDRYKYMPPLGSEDHLLSEIYLLATNLKSLKKPVSLKLPYSQENLDVFDMCLMHKKTDSEDWEWRDFTRSDRGYYIEFETTSTGIYVVTSVPKREHFEAPVQGMLYNAKISHQISIRFPKKATDVDLNVEIQITPLNRQNLPNLRRDFPSDMADLLYASDIVDIKPHIPKEFKRAVTVKLPLPVMDSDDFPQDDMVVMTYTPDGWELYDVPYKFTKSSVTFDTKQLSRYCVALSKPNRKRRLKEAFKHLDAESKVVRGQVLPFIHFQEKLWTLWVDVVPNEKIQNCINNRTKQGFKVLKATEEEEEETDQPIIRRNWRSRTKVVEKKPEREDLDLINGRAIDLDVMGDIRICDDDVGNNYMGLPYNDRVPENFRRFLIEPKPIEDRNLTAIIKLSLPDSTSVTGKKSLKTFEYDINVDAAKAYHYVEPEPEPEPEETKTVTFESADPITPPPPSPRQEKRPATASFMRLITPTKPPRLLIKESKVLTGRSLTCLAREIEQGLTLAIHLDISDSTITGMGFDALANGLSLVDITYRIMLLWKRRTSRFKGKQPDMLAQALSAMGRNDLASVVIEQHSKNEEIIPACFVPVED